jgi:ubiquinone/menaquinone biosynthesis C-methylase UbiE
MKTRSLHPELLDAPDIPREALYRNLYELDVINNQLGGHKVTIDGLKRLGLRKNKTYHLVDVGCGGGDTMRAVARWARKSGFLFRITGVDLKEDCCSFARKACRDYPEISVVQADYRDLLHTGSRIDILIASLFCHHLNDEDIIALLSWARKAAKVGVVINDLHRHPAAWYSIRTLSQLFSRSQLVKNDAPLSVQRGFTRSELTQLVLRAGIDNASLSWKWAFRWQVVYHGS